MNIRRCPGYAAPRKTAQPLDSAVSPSRMSGYQRESNFLSGNCGRYAIRAFQESGCGLGAKKGRTTMYSLMIVLSVSRWCFAGRCRCFARPIVQKIAVGKPCPPRWIVCLAPDGRLWYQLGSPSLRDRSVASIKEDLAREVPATVAESPGVFIALLNRVAGFGLFFAGSGSCWATTARRGSSTVSSRRITSYAASAFREANFRRASSPPTVGPTTVAGSSLSAACSRSTGRNGPATTSSTHRRIDSAVAWPRAPTVRRRSSPAPL